MGRSPATLFILCLILFVVAKKLQHNLRSWKFMETARSNVYEFPEKRLLRYH